jgi:RNA recognition motif-containing protein
VAAAFSEYGEVVSISLRKKGGEFDTKNWALVTFSEPEAAGRALFSEVSACADCRARPQLTPSADPAARYNRRWLSTRHLTRSS